MQMQQSDNDNRYFVFLSFIHKLPFLCSFIKIFIQNNDSFNNSSYIFARYVRLLYDNERSECNQQ